mgnify:FL=1
MAAMRSLSTNQQLVTLGFTGVIMPVEEDAVIVRHRQQLGTPPLRERSGIVIFRRLRLFLVCAFNLITNEL